MADATNVNATPTPPAIDERPVTREMATPVEQGAYDENGKLTHEGMHRVVQAGGSVMHQGKIYWRAQDLPSEADLAAGDPKKSAQVSADIQARIAALQGDLDRLRDTSGTTAQITPALVGHNLPAGVTMGGVGDGDTAGIDGDASDPERKAAAEKAAKDAADAADKEAKDAAKAQAAADKGK